ncbi:MAG: DUF2971 domain-containing protein [Acidimicrobiales bacterium]
MSDADDPGLLYHYTDANGLHGILTTGQLWATDARYLNDASELEYAFQLLAEVVNGLTTGSPPPGSPVQEVLNMIQLAADVQQELWRDDFACFVACFCQNPDVLSQWRGYARGGYAIGFKRADIESTSTEQQFGPYKFQRVDYDEEAKKKELRAQVISAVETYQRHGMKDQERLPVFQSLVDNYFGRLGFYAPLSKSPGFVEEMEWRIVSRVFSVELAEKGILNFRMDPALGLVPYVALGVSADRSPRRAHIGEIVIGPTAHPELARRSLRLLLASVGYGEDEVLITHSKVPLRA